MRDSQTSKMIEFTQQLLQQEAKKIGWEIDGSEIDLIINNPEWNSIVKMNDITNQVTCIIELVQDWARKTKETYL